MARKKTTDIVVVPATTSGSPASARLPDFSNIIQSEDLSLREKRDFILKQLGLKRPKQKYTSEAERKAARAKRREERRRLRAEILKQYGLEPRKKGPKLTPEERKKRRSSRGKMRRSFLREMALANPDLAKKYGIDVSKFKIK